MNSYYAVTGAINNTNTTALGANNSVNTSSSSASMAIYSRLMGGGGNGNAPQDQRNNG
jgi:hypothetical protein